MYGANESGWMDSEQYLSWFTKLFLPAISSLTVGKRNNLRVRVEGEAITSDEFQTLLEEEIASKEAKKKSRKGKKQTQKKPTGKLYYCTFQIPLGDETSHLANIFPFRFIFIILISFNINSYEKDEHQEAWIGCDNELMIVDAGFTSGVLVLNESQHHERGLYALIVANNTRHATFFILLNLIYLACTAPSLVFL